MDGDRVAGHFDVKRWPSWTIGRWRKRYSVFQSAAVSIKYISGLIRHDHGMIIIESDPCAEAGIGWVWIGEVADNMSRRIIKPRQGGFRCARAMLRTK